MRGGAGGAADGADGGGASGGDGGAVGSSGGGVRGARRSGQYSSVRVAVGTHRPADGERLSSGEVGDGHRVLRASHSETWLSAGASTRICLETQVVQWRPYATQGAPGGGLGGGGEGGG